MSNSEDSLSPAETDFVPFDESERSTSDEENKPEPWGKHYEDKDCFMISGNLINKNDLTRLVQSRDPEDVNQLNALVTKMVEEDNRRAFRYILSNSYKVGVLNNKGQTAVHLIFYDECQRVLQRQGLKDIGHKRYIFRVRPKESDSDCFDRIAERLMFSETHKNLAPGDLLYTMIQVWLITHPLNLKYTDCYGLTYLHAACFAGERMLVDKCIAAGLDVNAQVNHPDIIYKNYSALHFAIINPMMDTGNLVNILLKNGANIEAKDSLGRTALHLACRYYHCPFDFQIIDREMEKNKPENLAAIIIESPQKFYTKSLRFVRTLLEKHSDVNAKDNSGNTPLLSIFPEKYNEISRFTLDWHEFQVPIREVTGKFAYLVNAGADVTAKNENGDTILHFVTKNLKPWRDSSRYTDIEFDDTCHLEMMRKVLSLNPEIDVNFANNLGETPLQWAVDCMSSNIVKLLIDHGADLSSLIYKKDLFYYPNIVPNFHVVHNVSVMIELFKNADFYLTKEASLNILKFLLHETDDCECIIKNYRHYGIAFGSESHWRSILKRRYAMIDHIAELDDLLLHVKIIDDHNLYIDQDIRFFIEELTNLEDHELEDLLLTDLTNIEAEFQLIQSMGFEDNITLYNIIANHPYEIPEYIFKGFHKYIKQMEEFEYFGNMVVGHMTKAMLRHYVVKSSGRYIKILCPFLPELCCQIIGEFLSNENILNVCLALDVEEADEKYLLTK